VSSSPPVVGLSPARTCSRTLRPRAVAQRAQRLGCGEGHSGVLVLQRRTKPGDRRPGLHGAQRERCLLANVRIFVV